MDIAVQLNAVLAGRYVIEREIGAGGMAIVYLARDLRHDRMVALKVLRPELGAVLGSERFLSEIKTTAKLQHPHLLPLFDSGEANGLLYYVMPFIEGESLRERLQRERQLPVDEALDITIAVASALDYAHRQGVIHRDLKPENILLHDGEPLIADFGIALAIKAAAGTRVTQSGLVVGTPQYMSPEQAMGNRTIDARSDIYSLATILYEMLVGDPPLTATSTQAVIAKVLTERPASSRLYRDKVPEAVDDALQTALAKLPADRFANAAEFADNLTSARQMLGTRVIDARSALVPRPGQRLLSRRWLIAGIGILGLIIAALSWPGPDNAPQMYMFEETFESIELPEVNGSAITLSKDGSQLAYVGWAGTMETIYVRSLDGLASRVLKGTERGFTPSFSPNGRSIVFSAEGKIKKIPVAGGAATTVSDSGWAPTWTDRGEILFVVRDEIWRVPEDGGRRTLLAGPDSLHAYRYGAPHALPGGRAALIEIWKKSDLSTPTLGVVSIPDGKVEELGVVGLNPRYARGGFIVYALPGGAVYAAPFALRRARITGSAGQVLEGVSVKNAGATDLAMADNGLLIYKPNSEAGASELVHVDMKGTATPLGGGERRWSRPRISPDGRRIAVAVVSDSNDIWTYDLQTRTASRLTNSGGNNGLAEWTPDGSRIVYATQNPIGSDRWQLQWQPWDGSGVPEVFLDTMAHELSFGPAHTYFAIRYPRNSAHDIYIAPIDSPQKLMPLVVRPSVERSISISPDGKLIAYSSNESGRDEVYVRPIPGPGSRLQVSNSGGTEPMWSPKNELYYRTERQLMIATLTGGTEPALVKRDTVFSGMYVHNTWRANYDVFPDGSGFVMIRVTRGASRTKIYVVLNWTQQLKSLLREQS
jgi:eukaryotic-like serine/threonine-protein kinase